MAARPQGVLQLLEGLETALKARVPGVQFFFGREELNRPKSGPAVVWVVLAGIPSAETRTVEDDTGRRTVRDDMVQIQARATGSGNVSALERVARRAEYGTSEALFVVLADVVARLHQGYYEEESWRPVQPEQPADGGTPIDYIFSVRVQRLTLPRELTQPTSAPGDVVLESTS